MNRYHYQATTAKNVSVSKEIDANSVSEALSELEKQGLAVRSIEIVSPEKVASDLELSIFYSELEQILKRRSDWLPLLQSFAADLPRGRVRRDWEKQVQAVSSITTAQEFIERSDAIALLPFIVPRFHSDHNQRSKLNWDVQVLRQLESQSRYLNAFIYPVVLFGFAILAFVLASVFVYQGFGAILEAIGFRVPTSTQYLLWSSDQLIHHPLRSISCVLITGSFVVGLIRWWRSHAFTDRILGRLVAGRTSNLLAISKLTATLAELLELKSPLGLALSIAGRDCKHANYRCAAECLAIAARSGTVSEIPPQSKKVLPPLLLHALRPSESTQPHLPLLHELVALYGDRARNRFDPMVAGGPNIAIFLIGLFIMWLVVALFAPLIQIITSLSR